MKLDSLIEIGASSEENKKKMKLLSAFRSNFLDTELSKTVKSGATTTKKVIVPANDPIHFSSFGVFRKDLIQLIASFSEDVALTIEGQETNLQEFLNSLIDNAVLSPDDTLNDNNRMLWIDLAYGDSAPRSIGDTVKPSRKGLQLVFTAVKNGNKYNEKKENGVACYTTAKMAVGGNPTDPPLSGPLRPND